MCRNISNTSLDCSNLGLTAIPKDIPNTILALNLSFNEISQLDEDILKSVQQLEELDLSNNKISNIHRNAFENSLNLTKIDLKKNKISDLNAETFLDLTMLDSLDLSHNPLNLQDSFLIAPNLKNLFMDSCNLEEIPNDAFLNISNLESLSLKDNPFDNFDAMPFKPLSSLTSLRIHNLTKDVVDELCKYLEGIDYIYFDGFEISCFITKANHVESIDEALVTDNELPIQQPVLHKTTKKPPSTTTTTTTAMPTTSTIASVNHTGSLDQGQTSELSIDTTTTRQQVNNAVVDVDNQTIQYMLIGESFSTNIFIVLLERKKKSLRKRKKL